MIGSNHTEMEKKLLAQCEIGFEVGKVPPEAVGPISPTGEKYDQLSNPGMEPVSTEKEAYELALATFHKYVARKKGTTIYWRVRPEIEKGNGGWKFYMRLLVSDKPRAKVLASAQRMR